MLSLFNLTQTNPTFTVWLQLEGGIKNYQVVDLSFEFSQPVDQKGQSHGEVVGGQLAVTIDEIGDKVLAGWMLQPWRRYSGSIVFKAESQSAPMRIVFNNAYCVHMEESVNSVSKDGARLSLVISPEELIINDVDFNQFWS